MIDQHGLQRCNGKAGGYGEKAEPEHEGDGMPAQQHGGDGAGCHFDPTPPTRPVRAPR
jgi:hypothetical protein